MVVPLGYASVTETCADAHGAIDAVVVTVQYGFPPKVPALLAAVTPAGNPDRTSSTGPEMVWLLVFLMVNVAVPCFDTLLYVKPPELTDTELVTLMYAEKFAVTVDGPFTVRFCGFVAPVSAPENPVNT